MMIDERMDTGVKSGVKCGSGATKPGSSRKAFARLPLEVQAYVKSEVERRLAIARGYLQVENREIARKSSWQAWIRFSAGAFFTVGLALFTYLIAPDKIRDYIIARVDEKVTVPEIDNAAQRVLSEKLNVLAEEKMAPFEKRAEELHASLSNSEAKVVSIEKELELFSDISLARMFNRDAFLRIGKYSRSNGPFSHLCRMEMQAIRNQLILDRSAINYLVMMEPGVDGKTYSGPFSDDEIYDRFISEREDPFAAVNAMRSRRCKCFDVLLLDVATRCKNLKTAETSLAILENLGAPHTDVWHLDIVSNWVAKTVAVELQFPQEEYDLAMSKLKYEGPSSARSEILRVLDKFKSLEKLRTIAIVEALSRNDLDGAKSLYGGYADKSSRWRKTSDCYFMSATGGVDRATKKLIECSKQCSSLIFQLDSRRWWMMPRFFNMQELKDWVVSQRE